MPRKYRRRSLGQTEMAVFDPSQPSRVVGFNWRNPWVIGGAAAALGLIAWFALGGKKDKKKPATVSQAGGGSAASLPAASTGVVVATAPAAQVRVRASSGDSWSSIARKQYGDGRWWPALWDANRSGGTKFADPSVLRAGDDVIVPVLPMGDAAFRRAVFARADAYAQWYRSGRRTAVPAIVNEFTSVPVQNATAGTQVSSQTASTAAANQSASAPVSATDATPQSDRERMQSDAEAAWSALDDGAN